MPNRNGQKDRDVGLPSPWRSPGTVASRPFTPLEAAGRSPVHEIAQNHGAIGRAKDRDIVFIAVVIPGNGTTIRAPLKATAVPVAEAREIPGAVRRAEDRHGDAVTVVNRQANAGTSLPLAPLQRLRRSAGRNGLGIYMNGAILSRAKDRDIGPAVAIEIAVPASWRRCSPERGVRIAAGRLDSVIGLRVDVVLAGGESGCIPHDCPAPIGTEAIAVFPFDGLRSYPNTT